MDYEAFFDTSARGLGTNPVILLIDASGSTSSQFKGTKSILDRMEEMVTALPSEQFRVIFWNSDYPNPTNNVNFPRGVICPLHVITRGSLKHIFSFAKSKITSSCLTFPHVGFRAIPSEWISETSATHIYFITDGVMGPAAAHPIGSLKNLLRQEIVQLFTRHNHVHLHLITVEDKIYDFNQIETLNVAAGGDVFDVFRTNQLTKHITEFTCYTPNYPDGYKHIETVIPPAGYIPYGNRYFSETRINKFIMYLDHLIKSTPAEDDLLKIVQNLSATLRVLTKDKPRTQVENMVESFCQMFEGTALDPTMVQFILADTVRLEQQGQAMVFSQYRARLRDLYKQAQSLLQQNVKNATGITTEFLSLPVSNYLIHGNHMLVSETIHLCRTAYPNSSVKIRDQTVPVFPLLLERFPPALNEQCLRQWIRAIVAQQYHIDALGDLVIHVVLGLTLRVVLSPVEEKFKQGYRTLARIMLRKKRLNSDMTELERLETGELPTPNNGKIETFYGYMETVGRMLGLKCQPMTLWYALCLAVFGAPVEAQDTSPAPVLVKQLTHCLDAIHHDFPELAPSELLAKLTLKPVQAYQKSLTDYKCIITLEDCATAGGYLFKAHTSLTGAHCSPIYVVSRQGHELLLQREPIMCPICYQQIPRDGFQPIDPKTTDEPLLSEVEPELASQPVAAAATVEPIPATTGGTGTPSPAGTPSPTGTVIIMKGTVGAGKSTYATALQKEVEKLGGYCISEGTDKYNVMGVTGKAASQRVRQQLTRALQVTNPLKVVIIDTCGERPYDGRPFEVDFRGWKSLTVCPNYDAQKQPGYVAWSLRNVLLRQKTTQQSTYYLNPYGAGLKVCLDVHRKKCQTLFGSVKIPTFSPNETIESVIGKLATDAEEYQQFLTHTMPLEGEVAKTIALIRQ